MAAKKIAAKAEIAIAEPEMVTIAFEGFTATEEHGDAGEEEEFDIRGNSKMVMKTSKPLLIKKGETQQIPKEDFEYFVSKGQIRTKEQVEERELFIRQNQPVYLMSDEEKNLFLNDLPYEI